MSHVCIHYQSYSLFIYLFETESCYAVLAGLKLLGSSYLLPLDLVAIFNVCLLTFLLEFLTSLHHCHSIIVY
jgi:hypothetical protein